MPKPAWASELACGWHKDLDPGVRNALTCATAPCPHCHAKIFEQCRTLAGKPIYGPPHKGRQQKATMVICTCEKKEDPKPKPKRRRRGPGPKPQNTCADCGHQRKLHHDGICGDRECSAWNKYEDGQCPSQRDQR